MASKFVLEPEETDQLILDTIRKIQKLKKHAYPDLVCKKLSKDHGLDGSPFMLQLLSLMVMGKIDYFPTKEGLESLRINESKVNWHAENQAENGKRQKAIKR